MFICALILSICQFSVWFHECSIVAAIIALQLFIGHERLQVLGELQVVGELNTQMDFLFSQFWPIVNFLDLGRDWYHQKARLG